MRKLTCILLVLLLILPGCGKKAEEPQFICTACRQEFLNSGVVTDTDEEFCTYNGQGLIMSSERYHNGVLSFRSVWEYEDGHCIRQISYQEGTGRITETLENTYDKKGNHTEKTYHNPVTDKISESWEYTYELLDTTPET